MPITTVTGEDTRVLGELADSIARSKKAIIVTGAGISTNCGIPDFRSADGLYNLVKSRYPSAVVKGRDLFDSVLFADPTSTQLFYTFISSLRNEIISVKDTTPTHKFIRKMSESGRLLRCYTQNIDGLEEREGMTTNLFLGKGKRKRASTVLAGIVGSEEEKGCQVVQLHGDLNTLRCMQCQGLCKYDKERVESLLGGTAPECPECAGKDQQRRDNGKRGTKVGSLRPNIVLYGEEHPLAEKIGSLTAADLRSNPDIMIILGTSLKVFGLKRIVREFAKAVHARGGKVIYVNNTPAANSTWKDVIDYHIDMDCDKWVADVKKRRFDIWEVQVKLDLGKVTKKLTASLTKGKSNKGKIFNETDKENELAARPKVKATGARKPLASSSGNGSLPKKPITKKTITKKPITKVPICPPTPPPTNGSRPEKKSTIKRVQNTPYNPPSAPSTPTRRNKSTFISAPVLATPTHSPQSRTPSRITRMMASVGLKSPWKENVNYCARDGSGSLDQSPLPKAKRQMLDKVVVKSKGLDRNELQAGVELAVCGALTPVKVLTPLKALSNMPALERRCSRRLSKLPVEVST